jgi:ligand-binding SRPBCC domain-containing protein
MSAYYYNAAQFLPIDIYTAWSFFSDVKNLAVITPLELDFKILTELDGAEIYKGMLIDYTVKPLFGIPVKWQTEICKVEKPGMFTDRQLKGPYKVWEHTHTFLKKDNGTLVNDRVKYELPFEIIGQITHSLIVKKKIEQIFIYRKEVLKKLFIEHGNNHN